MTGDDVKSIDISRIDGLMHVGIVDDALVKRALHFRDIDTQTAGGIGLRISIDHEDGLFQRSQRGGQINGRRRLTYTALLVCQSNNLTHYS